MKVKGEVSERRAWMPHKILEARFTHEEIVRKYNRIASIYDLFGILMASRARRKALELAAIRDGEKILEVALGTGLNFIEILEKNPTGWVEGIDVSMGMLQRAKRKIAKTGRRNYALYLSDCRHLPFPDGRFNLLMNLYLLDILPVEDFVPVLAEFKRVLKDGGRIILVNTTKAERWINQLYEGMYRLKPPIVAGSRGVLAQPFLEKIGFKEIRRTVISQLTFPSEIVVAIKK
jgi:ubiquinone/menaquinone biosynthesis C-methylase UbiE